MAPMPQGCARMAGAVEDDQSAAPAPAPQDTPEEQTMTATVGQAAPDFTAPAYYRGDFTTITLSDYFGKWILLCFYPGDFTFV